MSTVIGAMEAYLKLNIDDFEKNLEAAKQQVASISTGFDTLTAVGDKVSGVGKTLTATLTTPIVGMGAACVKTTADFDSAMSKVGAISGATGGDLAKLRAKAKEMGESTKFSATKSAEAFTYMAMAGWNSGQMIDGIAGIMNLAAADGLDLATTSDIVTDALTAFGLEAKDSGHFADVLAKASSSANTNVSMLGESFKYVAPVAGSLGYSAEDTAVALGLMANSGIKGSQAGTSLRAALTRMIKPTDAAAKLMSQYGLSMTNSDGSMKSLGEVMAMLRTKLGNLTEAEQAQIAAELFGQEAMSGMLSIINASESDYDNLTTAIGNADGTAQKMADTMNDNLRGQLVLLKSQLEGVAIQIGEKLIPHIRSFLTRVSEWITKFSELFKVHGDLILRIAGVVAAIGPMLFAVGKAVSIYGKMKSAITNIKAICQATGPALNALKASIASISAPVLIIVGVIAVLVAAFKHLWDTNEAFRVAMTNIWNGIVSAVQGFCQGIVDRLNALGFNFQSITDVLKAIWDGFCNFLAPIFEGAFALISTILSTVLNTLTGLFDIFAGIFTGNWSMVWQGVKEVFGGIWNGISSAFGTVLNMLKGLANVFLGWFGTNWNTVWTSIQSFFVGIWTGITSFFSGILSGIRLIATTAWTGIQTAISTVMTTISSVITTVWTAIRTTITTVAMGIWTFLTNIWNTISTTISTVVNTIWNTIKTVFQTILLNITTIVLGIKNIISNIFNAIVSFLSGNTAAAKQYIVNAWTTAKNMVTAVVNNLKTIISTVFNAIKTIISTVMNAIKSVMSTVWNGIKSAVTTVVNAIRNIVSNVWNGIKGATTTTWNGIKSAVSTVVNAIRTAVSTAWNSIKSTTTTVWNGIKTGVSVAITGAKAAATTAANNIRSGLTTAWNSVKSATSTAFNAVKTSIGTALQNAVSTAKSKCLSILNGMKGVFANVSTTFSTIGKNVISGIINGIGSMVSSLYTSIKNALSGLVDKAKAALGIASPSRVFRDVIGKMVPKGIAVGVEANTSEAEDSVYSMTNSVLRTADTFRQRFLNLMNIKPGPGYDWALAGLGGGNIRIGSGMAKNDYSGLTKTGQSVVEKTEINIEKIEVRDDRDLDMVTQGLYNRQDQNLRALGRRNI